MKKRNIKAAFIGLFALASLLFAGCSNVLSPAQQTAGEGNVIVSFSAGRAAIMPSALDFDIYEFIFTNQGDGTTVNESRGKGGQFSFTLNMGETYVLAVKAYKGSVSGDNLGAVGTSKSFKVGAVTKVDVTLAGFLTEGVTGTFSYCIKLPEGAEVEKLDLYLDNEETALPLAKEVIDGVISNSQEVPAGRYLLRVWLNMDAREAEDYQGIVIYSNAVTNYGTAGEPVVFSSADFKYPGYANVPKKYIALSFDDGPNWTWTPQFLEVLEKYKAYATFYCIGGNFSGGEHSLADEIVRRGHELGNHTLTHSDTWLKSVETMVYELQETQNRIFAATGKYPTSMRAPCLWYTRDVNDSGQPVAYASGLAAQGIYHDWEKQYGQNIEEAARKAGLALMDATLHQANDFDTFPELYDTPEKFLNHVKYLAHDWGILLMHDSSHNTYMNLEPVLAWLRSENYEILSVEKLLEKRRESGLSYHDLEPGRIYYRFGEMYDHVKRISILKNSDVLSWFEEDNDCFKGEIIADYESSFTLSAAIITKNGGTLPSGELYWYSDDKSVVTIDEKTGALNAVGWGVTTVRAVAGGKVATLVVKVQGTTPVEFQTISTWEDFDRTGSIAGVGKSSAENNNMEYSGSGGQYTFGSYLGYDDVVRLSPPEGGCYNPAGIAFTFDLPPYTGRYHISADILVESSRNDVTVLWYDCTKFESGEIFRYRDIKPNTWASYSGSLGIAGASSTGLLTRRYDDPTGEQQYGLRNSVIYVKNLKIVLEGADDPIVDIPSSNIPVTTWDDFKFVFDIPGAPGEHSNPGGMYEGSNADYSFGDYYGYQNVLKLEPNKSTGLNAGIAMRYTAEQSGWYTLTMDAFIDDTELGMPYVWFYVPQWKSIIGQDKGAPLVPAATGEWKEYSGSYYLNKGDMIGFYTNWIDKRASFEDTSVYFRSFRLECDSLANPIINIECPPAAPSPNEDQDITIKWAEGEIPLTISVSGGSIVSQNPVTVTNGSTVTITAPGDYTSYQWLIGREEVSVTNTCTFTATEGSFKILLWVNDGDQGVSVAIKVTE